MNVAIQFHSEDYFKFVEESINSTFEDTDHDYSGALFLRKLIVDIHDAFNDCIESNTHVYEDLMDDNDPAVRLVAKLAYHFEKFYPDAILIGFMPIDLKGNLMAILHVPKGCVFNITCIR